MKKLLLILLSLWALGSRAQISEAFEKQRNNVFYNIYRYKVKSGLLLDYGLRLTMLKNITT